MTVSHVQPTTTPATTVPAFETPPAGPNWALIIGVIVVVVTLAVILILAIRRKPIGA